MATGYIRPRTSKDGKTKSFQVIVETEKDPLTGKRQRQYKTVKGGKKEADAMLKRMINELENSGAIIKPSALKLKDWMAEWLELYLPNIEATTRAGYTDRIKNKLIPYLGNIPLKDLKTSAIQEWVNTLHKDEELAPKSVKNVFLNLKAALDKAVVLHMIPYNPCTGVELPKLIKYKAEVYDDAEIVKLLETARKTDIYLLVVLIVTIGFRRGEITALTWDDIELDKNLLHIRHNTVIAGNKKITKAPKTEAGIRDIYLGENITALLKEEYAKYCADKLRLGKDFVDSRCVIRKPNGEAFSPDSLTQKWIRFINAHNLKHIRLHDLRHTCATAMLNAGISAKIIQKRLGHSDITTTLNIYAHALPSANKEAGNTIDDKILGQKQA